ncbi:MAG: type III PLP-dependent enzyme [Proteobacteria bacterium]|nr:type III PLP-dependent enzyme [Pseudomonadota bacterium]
MKNNTSEPPGRLRRSTNVISLTKSTISRIAPAYNERPTQRVYRTVDDMVFDLRPELPVYCLRPLTIAATAKRFLKAFPGDVLYAVKTNPDPRVLAYLVNAGVKHFDVASLAEVRLAHAASPDAQLYFMHPVKGREAIKAAYDQYGVRDFSLDSMQELAKIMEMTGHADDLGLYVRLAISNSDAAYSLSGKFGIAPEEAGELLKATRGAAKRLGVCFHVGSQCMDPEAYTRAVQRVVDMLAEHGVAIDVLDIGGGFPAVYPGLTPPPLADYMKAIRKAVKSHASLNGVQLICEPGRVMVAEGGSTVARVELRKGNTLYLNEGTYGSLFDAGFPGFVFPVKAIRPETHERGQLDMEMAEFKLFGPTCDSLDAMNGPFHLPANIQEGDWIEFGQLGSYGMTMATRFNGFQSDTVVEVADKPILTMMGVN